MINEGKIVSVHQIKTRAEAERLLPVVSEDEIKALAEARGQA
jgi:hypothetical protein